MNSETNSLAVCGAQSECNPAKHLALRLCSGQTIALPESGICLKQTWVDFINSVRQPIKERERFKIPLVVWIIDCLFPAPIGFSEIHS